MRANGSMKETNSQDGFIWQNGISGSHLPASGSDMLHERKRIIEIALQHNVRDIRTYAGYKGDLIVEVTSTASEALEQIQKYAEIMGMDVVLKRDSTPVGIHKIYCISIDTGIYRLKA